MITDFVISVKTYCKNSLRCVYLPGGITMTDAGSTFMTYIKNGREYFVYEDHGREIKKNFPFPESL